MVVNALWTIKKHLIPGVKASLNGVKRHDMQLLVGQFYNTMTQGSKKNGLRGT